MSYQTPGGLQAPAVTGRAFRAAGATSSFVITDEIDTSFGPVNFAMT
jgi:hypothetical protein|eukprot:COSAG06_NODE_2580_length_6620_cov_7.408373_1_plen_47_part_00